MFDSCRRSACSDYWPCRCGLCLRSPYRIVKEKADEDSVLVGQSQNWARLVAIIAAVVGIVAKSQLMVRSVRVCLYVAAGAQEARSSRENGDPSSWLSRVLCGSIRFLSHHFLCLSTFSLRHTGVDSRSFQILGTRDIGSDQLYIGEPSQCEQQWL